MNIFIYRYIYISIKNILCCVFRQCFIKLQEEKAQHIRIYARHTTDTLQTTVDEATAITLSLHTSADYDDPKLDLAIGSRVRVTRNIATQLGK